MKNTNNQKKVKTNSDRLEEIFAKHGLKLVWVEKTGCSCICSNRPSPKKDK